MFSFLNFFYLNFLTYFCRFTDWGRGGSGLSRETPRPPWLSSPRHSQASWETKSLLWVLSLPPGSPLERVTWKASSGPEQPQLTPLSAEELLQAPLW